MKKTVILMAPFFGAGGPLHLLAAAFVLAGVASVLRPAKSAGHQDDKWRGLKLRLFKATQKLR